MRPTRGRMHGKERSNVMRILKSKKFWGGAIAGTLFGKYALNQAGQLPVVGKIIR